MKRTTVYLPRDLKRALERMAKQRGCTEAELIRRAVRDLAATSTAPAPKLPLFRSDDPTLAERAEEALTGFGDT